MKKSLLDFLQCPACRGAYALKIHRQEDAEVMEGRLDCACGSFPIVSGVPRLLPTDVDPKNWSTAKRFGEQWNQFSKILPEHKAQFLTWITPVKGSDFIGKTVLDFGCGKGKHVLQAVDFGASTVIGIDLSHAVDAAFDNVGRLDGVHIIQADGYRLPLKPVFDYAYSLGVLHHTPSPRAAFLCMLEKVKPGGTLSIWVYGREGNGWIIYLVNPLRSITSRLWLPLTKWFSFVLTLILHGVLKVLYAPAARQQEGTGLRRYLPYSSYLCSISDFSFRENFIIVFDHLHPGIAFYLRREEIQEWFDSAHLLDITITQRYNNSWRGFARKPAAIAAL